MRSAIMTNKILYISALKEYSTEIFNAVVSYAPRLIAAFLLLIVGVYAIRFINKMLKKVMTSRDFDPTLSKFLADVLNWVLRILLFVSVISKLGIETSSFVAILGAAGLAVGLSLQGSLSNFAGGMLIILFKPFRVGDVIDFQNITGKVAEIQIFVTRIISNNNQTIFVPNGILSNGIIVNYSIDQNRRIDLVFRISYAANIELATTTIYDILKNNDLILPVPTPQVQVKELTETGILLSVRPWVKNENFGRVSSDVLLQCKQQFDVLGIEMKP